jgi:hypothetical protein
MDIFSREKNAGKRSGQPLGANLRAKMTFVMIPMINFAKNRIL